MITEEFRYKIFVRDGFICQKCGGHLVQYGSPQIAHRIRQRKQAENHVMQYIWQKYKKDRGRKWVRDFILDNELNLKSTCSGQCNSHFNIFTKSVERDALIDRIITETRCLIDCPDK
jgi:hypothetical protein